MQAQLLLKKFLSIYCILNTDWTSLNPVAIFRSSAMQTLMICDPCPEFSPNDYLRSRIHDTSWLNLWRDEGEYTEVYGVQKYSTCVTANCGHA